MSPIILHIHSILRWVLLFLMIYVFLKPRLANNNKVDLTLYTFIIFTVQLVLGIILYFTSPVVSFESGFMKDSILRFFTVEHALGMIIAYHLIMIVYFKARKSNSEKMAKKIRIYYGLALLITLLSIPWPFRGFGNGWF
ncbi:MAG: cytochrome B [Saprospiraceae bacterium]